MSPKMRCQQNEMSSKLKFSQNKNWIFKFNSRSLALIALALLFCDNDHIRQGRGSGGDWRGIKCTLAAPQYILFLAGRSKKSEMFYVICSKSYQADQQQQWNHGKEIQEEFIIETKVDMVLKSLTNHRGVSADQGHNRH